MSRRSCLNQYIKQKPELFLLKRQVVILPVSNLLIKQKGKVIKLEFQYTRRPTQPLLLVLTFRRQVQTMRSDIFLHLSECPLPRIVRKNVPNGLTDLKVSWLVLECADQGVDESWVFGEDVLWCELLLGLFWDWFVGGAHVNQGRIF